MLPPGGDPAGGGRPRLHHGRDAAHDDDPGTHTHTHLHTQSESGPIIALFVDVAP